MRPQFLRGFWKLTWLEAKIFTREPMGFVGTLVMPLVIFIVLGRALSIGKPVAAPDVDIPFNVAILAAVLCVVGHTFPVWLRFKGGKGVATSAGAVFGLMPLAAVIIFLVWVAVFEITRYVSVASLVAASALPVTVAWLLHWEIIEGAGLLYFSTVLAILVVWSHRTNFSRLLKGTEQRFTRK